MEDTHIRFGIIGFGRFGQLVARHLAEDGEIAVHDPFLELQSNRHPLVPGCFPASLADAARSHVVILAVPIRALRSALESVAPFLRPGAIVLDVASVKTLPLRWMDEFLPESVDFIGTHPLFGPDSAPGRLDEQKIVVIPGRVSRQRLERASRYLRRKGLRIVQTTAPEHDRSMARTQSFTHFLGRALSQTGFRPEPLDTLGYRLLLDVERFVSRDSWELFEDMLLFNPHASEVRKRFRASLDLLEDRVDELGTRLAEGGSVENPEREP